MSFLSGRKTIIGGIVLSLIGLVAGIDSLVSGEWFSREQYEAAIAFVGGLTGVSMRLGIAKAEQQKP